MSSDTFLTGYRKNCHCEPVTDVTGVAIRIQMGNPRHCAQMRRNRHTSPRGTGKPVPYGRMGKACLWSEGERKRNIVGKRIATPVCELARNDREAGYTGGKALLHAVLAGAGGASPSPTAGLGGRFRWGCTAGKNKCPPAVDIFMNLRIIVYIDTPKRPSPISERE